MCPNLPDLQDAQFHYGWCKLSNFGHKMTYTQLFGITSVAIENTNEHACKRARLTLTLLKYNPHEGESFFLVVHALGRKTLALNEISCYDRLDHYIVPGHSYMSTSFPGWDASRCHDLNHETHCSTRLGDPGEQGILVGASTGLVCMRPIFFYVQ